MWNEWIVAKNGPLELSAVFQDLSQPKTRARVPYQFLRKIPMLSKHLWVLGSNLVPSPRKSYQIGLSTQCVCAIQLLVWGLKKYVFSWFWHLRWSTSSRIGWNLVKSREKLIFWKLWCSPFQKSKIFVILWIFQENDSFCWSALFATQRVAQHALFHRWLLVFSSKISKICRIQNLQKLWNWIAKTF